jgi:hypothetical protein
VHAFKWFDLDEVGIYWKSSEREFHEFAMYYGLQELSVKAAAWNLMRRGKEPSTFRGGLMKARVMLHLPPTFWLEDR